MNVTEDLHLRIRDLRKALDRTLRAVEAELGKKVELPYDYYWELPVEAAFDMTRNPAPDDFMTGQLTDDLEEGLAARRDTPAVWHELNHLIGLLRALERISMP